ncbi:hypothetical protein GQ457_15G012140 [Hibiscus cannabinus]
MRSSVLVFSLQCFNFSCNEVRLPFLDTQVSPPKFYGLHMVTKENRTAGVLENLAEGQKYVEHFLRKYVRNNAAEIMSGINSFFTDPK